MCRIVKVAGILLALTLIASGLLLTACGGGEAAKSPLPLPATASLQYMS